jgi:radical SAM protein with 4Fe4S-binding SPASM domain
MNRDLKVLAFCFTNGCNLSCAHCGCDPKGADLKNELPAAFFADICRQGRDLGAVQANITGGEAFFRHDCFDLIEDALNLGLFTTVESNGTLLTQTEISRLASYGGQIRLSISLDGFNPAVNDKIRGQGTFLKIMETLNRVAEAGIPARVISVLHGENLGQIPDMARFVVDGLGLGFRLIPSIIEYGRGVYACQQVGASWDQITQVLEGFYYDFLREHDDDRLSVELNPALVPIEVNHKYHHVCPWGLSMIGIGPTGQAGLCHVGINDPRFTTGDLTREPLADIWEHNEVLTKFRAMTGNELLGVCGNCQARNFCRGGCRVHAINKYGGFFSPSPQCQAVYELGKFPDYALKDDTMDCHLPT